VEQGEAGAVDFFTAAPNTESIFSTFRAPHLGQGGGEAEYDFARCSNPSPQVRQVYSKMGIFIFLVNGQRLTVNGH